ncbi:hypothetical protein [Flavobacterium sp. GT3R68]|uniref:hypothetical protein n=1 Tax=Flavobacterium sp. GT3R68 TaxID=2594437 RepID=UPI000F8640DC|nr:hypothetical protein [Flavobacterium sp. GT3R68]RTY95947.1 hypothetical protein EKL32_04690 [Flavobacterium sp. GSN2]TRW93719.1 hypothetical protein FNW07_02080 [Flavobacterium sp. GT3R68]
MKKLALILLFTSVFVSCHSQKEAAKAMKATIGETYFQNWVAGVRGGGSGTNFYIQCKKPVPKQIILKALYFRDKKSPIHKDSETEYSAGFTGDANKEKASDLNPTPIKGQKVTPPYPITDNEAIIEYSFKGKKAYYKLSTIKEQELKAYPSARPRN